MKGRTILLGLFIALAAYALLNSLVLKRPITLGYIEKSYLKKEQAAQELVTAGRRKILVAAGSNGLYSHRCETIESVTGYPCVNMAVSYITGLETILRKAEQYARPGDVVLLPLEYGFYGSTDEELRNNISGNRFLVLYEPGLIPGRSLRETTAIFFSLSLRDVFTSLGEMAFRRLGIMRDTDQYQLNRQGDIVGHTASRAKPYAAFLSGEKANDPNSGLVDGVQFAGAAVISDFVQRLTARGVSVVGSLPTTFDDAPLDPRFIAWFQRFYEQAGGHAVVLPNHGRYPRARFYNTKYHLNEEGQIEHSRLLARQLCNARIITDCPVAQEPAP